AATSRTSFPEGDSSHSWPWELEAVSGSDIKVNFRNRTRIRRSEWEKDCMRRTRNDDRFFLAHFDAIISGLSTFNLWYVIETATRDIKKKLLATYPAESRLRGLYARIAADGKQVEDLGK
ncbi:unnamed protein product, partial [Amoebophrya sp. A25]